MNRPIPTVRRPSNFVRIRCEQLEDRLAPATFVVNDSRNLGDANPSDGKPLTVDKTVTLRAVFDHVNRVGGNHVIKFSGPMTINLSGATLAYGGEGQPSGALTIDGFRDSVGAPAVKIIGGLRLWHGSYVHDLQITGSSYRGLIVHSNCRVINNVIAGSADIGLFVHGNGSVVQGNYIGVSADGKTAQANDYGIGVQGSFNVIGGANAVARNVISGNKHDGVNIWTTTPAATGNIVKGNYIGVSADGKTAVPNVGYGIAFTGNNNQIGGLALGEGNLFNAIGGLGAVVLVGGASSTGNGINGNLIGTKPDGKSMFTLAANTPAQSVGIYISASNNLTNTSVKNNVIADCTYGIYVAQSGTKALTGTLIQGNKIGVGIDGAGALRNRDGIVLSHVEAVTIGGTAAASKNIISGNSRYGVLLTSNANKNRIYGNYIGTNAASAALGNGVNGVRIDSGAGNFIGMPMITYPVNPIYGNVIANNGALANIAGGERGHGVEIDNGDNNTVRGNQFHDNKGLSIYLRDPSHLLELPQNDVGATTGQVLTKLADLDAGPNKLQNFPALKSLDVTKKTMTWQLNSDSKKAYVIDFYSDESASKFGPGQGGKFISSKTVTTDLLGHAEITIPWVKDRLVAATATDSLGNTSPFSIVDSDADGLADGWEIDAYGIDLNMDGVSDQKLVGANPLKKDLYLEADVMNGALAAGMDINNVFALVTQAFANAPASVNNPDGKGGVVLHVNPGGGLSAVTADALLDPVWTEFEAVKQVNFGSGSDLQKKARAMAFRYVLFAQRYSNPVNGKTGSSGIAELGLIEDPGVAGKFQVVGGNDFIVSVRPEFFSKAATGKVVTAQDLAGTLMHEMGHTLGLMHGGTDLTNNKPNYHSIMNYLWQFPNSEFRKGRADADYTASWMLDYSAKPFPNINESALSEAATTIGGTAGHLVPVGTRFWNAAVGAWVTPSLAVQPRPFHVIPESGKELIGGKSFIDWKRTNSLDLAAQRVDLNRDGKPSILGGAEDWSHLIYNFRESPNSGGSHGAEFDEQSSEEFTPGPQDPRAVEVFVAGPDAGSSPRVQVYDPDGKIVLDFPAFSSSFKGGVRVAKGDVNGDGVADIIAAMGPGGDSVKAFNGKSGAPLFNVAPFGVGFTGGLNVAAGDTNGDGKAEVFVAPASGVGSTVKILSGTNGSEVRSFLAYFTTTKTGVTIAAGDVNGDGKADVITAPASGANPLIKIFNGADGKLLRSFVAYSPAYNGVFIAAADVNGDGKADIIAGAGAGTTASHVPLVRTYSGANPALILNSFLADGLEFHGGVRVATQKLVDGSYNIITGTGPDKRQVRRFWSKTLNENWAVETFDATFQGVFVG